MIYSFLEGHDAQYLDSFSDLCELRRAMDTDSRCQNPSPYSIESLKAIWLVGLALSSICYGILLLLGLLCFIALWRGKDSKGGSRTRLGLKIYITLTVITATVAEAWEVVVTTTGVLDMFCTSMRLMPRNPYVGKIDVVFFIMNCLTDGLLVWRCYVLATGLGGKRWLVAWIAPLVIYVALLVTGPVLLSNPPAGVVNGLVTAQIAISLFLNVTISTSILSLLFRYRNMVTRVFGKDSGKVYLNTMTILVESASLIVMMDVFVIATVRGNIGGYVSFQMWVHVQPIASFLIIYQIARHVDYFRQKDEVTEAFQNSVSATGIQRMDLRREGRQAETLTFHEP